MTRIAFLGAGNMGVGMIRNLLRCGHEVAVFNRTPDKALPLKAEGARICDTPAEAVTSASAILAMLIDDSASRAVWTGPNGVLAASLGPDVLAVECSSVSRDWILELGRLGAGRMTLVDCPVAGRPDAAAAGTLKVFAGGPEAAVARAAPLLAAFSTVVTRFGALGSGATFKLIYNMLGASQIAAVAEALRACDRMGIDLSSAAAAFSEGNTGSPHLVRHAGWMASGDHPTPPQFSGEGRIKDLLYVRDMLAGVGFQSLTGEATLSLFDRMRTAGISGQNDSRLIDAL
jgi:3-hydroxyisobutyrate dehydrogenase